MVPDSSHSFKFLILGHLKSLMQYTIGMAIRLGTTDRTLHVKAIHEDESNNIPFLYT
jgi:hypothetical protein